KLVRVRYARDRIIPHYVDTSDPTLLGVAERLVEVFRTHVGQTRGGLEETLRETFGDDPAQLLHQGLAKLLEDRCTFEIVSGQPPEQIREAVFRTAAAHRAAGRGSTSPSTDAGLPSLPHFDRSAVLQEVADTLGLTPQDVDQALFADLKSEQRLIRYKEISAERLL